LAHADKPADVIVVMHQQVQRERSNAEDSGVPRTLGGVPFFGANCGGQFGARADRRELLKMLKALSPGDVVTVTRIDRLARSTFDLFAIVKQIVDAKAQFRSLAEPWADTATSTGRLMIRSPGLRNA
jgi:DNA invertase Pin-like site-specific DNA recombinase